jgi:putative flippase GtrA
VTCPSLLRRRPAAADPLGDLSVEPEGWTGTVAGFLGREDTVSEFARFLLVGVATTLVYALLFVPLEDSGYLAAHLFATAVSTALAIELHRRLTFRAGERVGWLTAQVEAGGVTLLGLGATSTALGWLEATAGDADAVLQIALVSAVTALIGLLRFVALRWIFRPATAGSA